VYASQSSCFVSTFNTHKNISLDTDLIGFSPTNSEEYTQRKANAQTHRPILKCIVYHLFIIQRSVLTPKCFSPYLERSLDHLRTL